MLNQRINDWSEESGILSQAQFAYLEKLQHHRCHLCPETLSCSLLNRLSMLSCCGFIDFSEVFDKF